MSRTGAGQPSGLDPRCSVDMDPRSQPASSGHGSCITKVVTAGTTPVPSVYPYFSALLSVIDAVHSPLGTGQSDAWRVSADTWLSFGLTVAQMRARFDTS